MRERKENMKGDTRAKEKQGEIWEEARRDEMLKLGSICQDMKGLLWDEPTTHGRFGPCLHQEQQWDKELWWLMDWCQNVTSQVSLILGTVQPGSNHEWARTLALQTETSHSSLTQLRQIGICHPSILQGTEKSRWHWSPCCHTTGIVLEVWQSSLPKSVPDPNLIEWDRTLWKAAGLSGLLWSNVDRTRTRGLTRSNPDQWLHLTSQCVHIRADQRSAKPCHISPPTDGVPCNILLFITTYPSQV